MNQEDLSGKLADCRHIKLNMKLSKGELYEFLTNIYDVTEVPVVFQLPQVPKVWIICNYQSIEPI